MNYSEAVSILTQLYRKHMGREPDIQGLNFWANALSNGQTTTNDVEANFSNTPEAKQYTKALEATVHNIYWSELGRMAEASGLNNNVNSLRNGNSEQNIRVPIHNSPEAIRYRNSIPQIPQPDPRLAAMQIFNAKGDAIVDYRRGDTLTSIAQQAYGDLNLWWVIAQANNAMSDRELSFSSKIIIPNIENSDANPYSKQIEDNGYAFLYINIITGVQWARYYIPVSSQLDPIEFEDNPNWLRGIAFVNGNDVWNRPDFQIARSLPNPVMPPSYWSAMKDSPQIPLDDIRPPLDINTAVLEQLPIFSGSGTDIDPPPPLVKYTPGADPASAIQAMKKYDSLILTALKLSDVQVIVVKKSIVEYFPQLAGQPIPGWNGVKWDQSPGGFYSRYKVITVATDADRKKDGSISLFDHELAHAYDWAMGKISLTPTFEAAFNADFGALRDESPVVQYYTKSDDSGLFTRAQSETYAESFANYHTGNARWFSNKPALLKYFRSFYRPPTNR